MAEETAGGAAAGGDGRTVHQTAVHHGDGTLVSAQRIDAVNITVNQGHARAEPPTRETELAHAADELAEVIRARRQDEERGLRIQDIDPLPVAWTPVDRGRTYDGAAAPAMDRLKQVWGEKPVGSLAGTLDEITEVYERLPDNGRLVVLGAAGSGKTLLGLRFVLKRLESGRQGRAVPEVFGLGSWNLAEDPLEVWLARRLRRDQPWLGAVTADGRTTLAERLVRANLVLPVLDGFDEIPRKLRDLARQRLCATSLPYVLSSRWAEYEEAMRGTRGLHRAAVVRLTGLSQDDRAEYLRDASPEGAEADWGEVADAIRHDPRGPLGRALATPLMIDLAATVHGERGTSGTGSADDRERRPITLLRPEFDSAEKITDHLLGGFVPAVYRDEPEEHRERLLEWHGYLAHQLAAAEPDLKWWELGSTLSRPVRLLAVGSVTGVAFGLADMLIVWSLTQFVTPRPAHWFLAGLLHGAFLGLLTGTGFGLVYALTNGGAPREPSGVSIRLLGGTRPSRRTFVRRLVVGAGCGFGFGSVTWLATGLVYGAASGMSATATLLTGLRNGLAGGLVSGLALGLAYGGGAGGPSQGRPPLRTVLGHFRRRVGPRLLIGYAVTFPFMFVYGMVGPLVSGLAAGAVPGFRTVLATACVAGLSYGPMVGLAYALTAALAAPVRPEATHEPDRLLRTDRTAVLQQILVNTVVFGVVGWLLYGPGGDVADWLFYTLTGGVGVGLAYGLALTAWGHWTVLARIWLPLTGRLPWAVGAFLKDAHRRGVLRHSGAVYQFRHARLKEHLARTYEKG